MDNEQFSRALQSVGQTCFVRFFDIFYSQSLSREDVIDILKSNTDYTEKSCSSRVSHARSIINSGLSIKALESVISANSQKVTEETKALARLLIQKLNT